MPAPVDLLKAEIREINLDRPQAGPINPNNTVKVQFNPETLTVNYSNQKAGGDQRGGSAMQFVGSGTTKLSLDLWFDVTVNEEEDDVRKLTEKVNYFVKPKRQGSGRNVKWKAPGVQFIWGTFLFNGVIDSVNEKLEYFSEDGKPLRAMLSISISSQDIQFEFGDQQAEENARRNTPGTQQQIFAKVGDTIQKIAASIGRRGNWQPIAEANGVENSRRLTPGTPINPNIGNRS